MKEWPSTLLDSLLPYKKIQLINGVEMAKFVTSGINLVNEKVYCGVFFIKAGKQYTVVRHEGSVYV